MKTNKAFLSAASVLMLAGCGTHLSREQIIDYGEIGYSDIISFITVGFQTGWDGMTPQEMNLSPVYSYCSPYAGFAKTDIDGDGYDELIVGDQFEDGSYVLYDIYCFNKKNASLIHLAGGGERDNYTITGTGVIVETGSNSAEDSFTKGYRIVRDRLEEVKGGWDRSLMPVNLERFSDLASPQQLCGGYTQQREPTDEEMEMFRSVTISHNVTYTPLSVSTQVVAGTNYRFRCRYQDSSGDSYCNIIIFKPLPGRGEPVITSVEKE